MEIYAIKTWFDQHYGVVQVEDDVLSVVRRLKEIDQRLAVFFNPQSGAYDVVERCLDGVERLVCTVDKLDQRVINQILQADHWGADTPGSELKRPEGQDFLTDIEREEAEFEEKIKEETVDRVGDIGERLAWALDICSDHHSVGGSISVPKDVKK